MKNFCKRLCSCLSKICTSLGRFFCKCCKGRRNRVHPAINAQQLPIAPLPLPGVNEMENAELNPSELQIPRAPIINTRSIASHENQSALVQNPFSGHNGKIYHESQNIEVRFQISIPVNVARARSTPPEDYEAPVKTASVGFGSVPKGVNASDNTVIRDRVKRLVGHNANTTMLGSNSKNSNTQKQKSVLDPKEARKKPAKKLKENQKSSSERGPGKSLEDYQLELRKALDGLRVSEPLNLSNFILISLMNEKGSQIPMYIQESSTVNNAGPILSFLREKNLKTVQDNNNEQQGDKLTEVIISPGGPKIPSLKQLHKPRR